MFDVFTWQNILISTPFAAAHEEKEQKEHVWREFIDIILIHRVPFYISCFTSGRSKTWMYSTFYIATTFCTNVPAQLHTSISIKK